MYDTATTHPNQPDPPPTQHTRPPATCRPGTRHRETVPAIQSTPPDHEVHRRHPWPGAEATTSTVLTCDATTPATTSRALSASRSRLKHGTNQVCPPTPNRDQMQPELPHPRDNVDSATVDRERSPRFASSSATDTTAPRRSCFPASAPGRPPYLSSGSTARKSRPVTTGGPPSSTV